MAAAKPEIRVDPKGVYLVAWNLKPEKFHWGVFVAFTDKAGVLFHCANGDRKTEEWEFRERTNYRIDNSLAFLAGVKVSQMYNIADGVMQRLRDRLLKLDFDSKTDHCQIWARNAIYLMANEGFLPLQPDMNDIMPMEVEAEQIAMVCQESGLREITMSKFYG